MELTNQVKCGELQGALLRLGQRHPLVLATLDHLSDEIAERPSRLVKREASGYVLGSSGSGPGRSDEEVTGGRLMWAFLIGLAVSVVKTFATSAASSAGAKIGEALVSGFGEERKQIVVAGSQPGAPRDQQISASQQLLSALKQDEAFRNEVRAILARDAPDALAAGEQVQKQLAAAPGIEKEVVSGVRPVTDFMDPTYLWTSMSPVPISDEQARFLRSPTFHRVCPIGGEDLGFAPEVMGAVNYLNTAFGGKVDLPTMVLPGNPSWFTAECKNRHRWQVFATA